MAWTSDDLTSLLGVAAGSVISAAVTAAVLSVWAPGPPIPAWPPQVAPSPHAPHPPAAPVPPSPPESAPELDVDPEVLHRPIIPDVMHEMPDAVGWSSARMPDSPGGSGP